MDDYLVKPVRASELFVAIDRVVGARSPGSGLRSQESGVWNQESGSGSQKSPADLTPDSCLLTPGTNDLLDPAALLAACDGDAELLRRMCRHFQTFAPGRLAEVAEALRDRDSLRLREAAHKLGGMVSSFSATAAEAAALLVRLSGEGKIEEATQTNSWLTEMVERLVAEAETLSIEKLQRWRQGAQELASRR
jgi:HPt (histidine-containing phosphotransfer) domain-containing protein